MSINLKLNKQVILGKQTEPEKSDYSCHSRNKSSSKLQESATPA